MSQVRRRRARRSASEWRSIMGRFERGGWTVAEFCRSESLAPNTFWRWRRKLADADKPMSRNGSVGKAAFVELADAAAPAPVWDAELELGGGVVLRLRRC